MKRFVILLSVVCAVRGLLGGGHRGGVGGSGGGLLGGSGGFGGGSSLGGTGATSHQFGGFGIPGTATGSAGGNVVSGETTGPGGVTSVTSTSAKAEGSAFGGGSSFNVGKASSAKGSGILGQFSTSDTGAVSVQSGGGGYY
ncbi:glycine-rich cell wall structural protein-like [Pollicipes pollicipes]|uniref:glycine-rich cell wall structural protein-like n=1 Tax=Pollicipes pollicipes TaxID=41117 RepID=UPI001884F53C|nr:glycine-rich cell wall structural protein-like [Pollicipes pollicipes]